ncbi:RnfABCDGE type electron transport complex subunit D [bacterium]|nr:RnfABCDGE type electron transport complex subunit D [bacterium]
MDDRFYVSAPPHIRTRYDAKYIMRQVTVALIPPTIAGIVFFGIRAVLVLLISVLSSILWQRLVLFVKGEKRALDGSEVVTGLLLALNLSPLVPWWIPIVGTFIAIVLAKELFGGLGFNIFNPALIARAFLLVSWPMEMTTWMSPFNGVTQATPLTFLKLQHTYTPYINLFLGNRGGCIGETSVLALLIGAGYLFFRGVIDWKIPVPYVLTVGVLALAFKQDPLFHIMAGGLILGAFFMATDYTTTPITKLGRIIFGISCGVITILIRLFGGYPEGVSFSILFMNAMTPLLDRWTIPKPFGYKTLRRNV